MLKAAPLPPFSKPSAAASFMGWFSAISMPERSPVNKTSKAETTPTVAPTLMLAKAIFLLRPRKRYQQLTPTTKTAPVIQLLVTVWQNLLTAAGEKATAKKSIISLRTVSGLKSIPTGCCIHELATKIHQAESVAPRPVSQVEARWKRRLTLFQPKNITAINVASIKKATMPSMANGAPKMSPTNHE